MLSLEVRKRAGGAEVHRLAQGAASVGASSGNEVVVRARGVAGRHVRIFEKEGSYHLDLYKGAGAVIVNGRAFSGGAISPGDRITIGEATITVLGVRVPVHREPIHESTASGTGPPVPVAEKPATEVEYRDLRLEAYRLCRQRRPPEALATGLVDLLDREFDPSEWAVGSFLPDTGFRPLASSFLESPALPPRLLEDARAGERIARAETVTGVLTLLVEPQQESGPAFAILVRETPRLPARAVVFLEELVQVAGLAARSVGNGPESTRPVPPPEIPRPARAEPSEAEAALHQTDDLKRIIETVEREVIDRAMLRVEGNQSRAAQVLNISRGSLIAKLKEYQIPDYRYLRRERKKS
ncbi:MAG TPA: helix-turn-helix domain-containing protein [Thermoanaerobaculia bacterium]|nr:helix-turn-helix domain-containing protein [Thermoanaerobaculia bacterium]